MPEPVVADPIIPEVNPDPIVPEDNSVAYETHKKLLSQRKKDQEVMKEMSDRLDAFDKIEEGKKTKQLEEQGEYKKILAEREDRINSLQDQINQDKQMRSNSQKESAFIQALPSKLLNPAYLSFMDKEGIAIDPDTGSVDQGSLKQVVDLFMKDHSHLLEQPQGKNKIPNNSSASPNNMLNVDDSKSDLEKLAHLI